MKELVSALCTIAFLGVAIETLLPDGSFQKYARLVTGLLVLMILVNTFLTHRDVAQWEWEVPETVWSADAAEKEQEAKIMVEYRRRLEESISEKYGVEANAEIGADMSIHSVTLGDGASDEVCAAICREYGLSKEQVKRR